MLPDSTSVTFASLPRTLGAPLAVPLPPDRARIAWRMAQQAWGRIRYEQPTIAAGIAAAPPLVALAGMAAYAD